MSLDPRRRVPRTDAVLADPRLVAAMAQVGRASVKRVVGRVLDQVRAGDLDPDSCADEAVRLLSDEPAGLRPVLNATGVVLHTNLGRAPLAPAAVAALRDAAGYVDVEFDLATGQRARRGRGMLDALRRAVPDAGDVHVVNNGAAALVLATTALAAGREVVVSSGEMVEIGDGFRLPDLIASTGARLREVGTTNRVTLGRLRGGDRAGHRCGAQGPPQQLPHRGLHQLRRGRRTRRARCAGDRRHRQRPARALPVPARRARRRLDAAGRSDGRHLQRRQAARRPAGRPAVRGRGHDRPAAPPPAGPGSARRQADPRRARGHPRRSADPRCAVPRRRRRRPARPLRGVGRRARRHRRRIGRGGRWRCGPRSSTAGLGGRAARGRFAQRLRSGRVPVIARIERDRCLLDLRCIPPGRDDALRDAVLAVTGG